MLILQSKSCHMLFVIIEDILLERWFSHFLDGFQSIFALWGFFQSDVFHCIKGVVGSIVLNLDAPYW